MKKILKFMLIMAIIILSVNFAPVAAHDNGNEHHNCNLSNDGSGNHYDAENCGPEVIYVDRIVYVDKIVEKIVYVDKIIEKIIYKDKIVEVIKEVPVIEYRDKIVYTDKIVYKDKIVEKVVYKDKEVEKIVYVDKPVEVIKEVEKIVYVDKPTEQPVACNWCSCIEQYNWAIWTFIIAVIINTLVNILRLFKRNNK